MVFTGVISPSPHGTRRWHWLLVVAIIGLAALIRLYHLDASPLRGDEAFTVRYWAVPFEQALTLSRVEPHPFGALFGFGLWKSLVGDSAFAMRLFPALLNLIGVPVLYALGKRLFNEARIGYIAALLWAFNPLQLYHAQDVRDYGAWAALSALAIWLLLLACDRRRPVDWLLYGLAALAALYMYFAEASLLLVGLVYVMLWRRPVWRDYLLTLTGIGVGLLPWLWQAWQLAHSGYGGTADYTKLPALWMHFLPALLVGDTNKLLDSYWSTLALLLGLCLWLLIRRGYGPRVLFLGLYAGLPTLLLTLISVKLAVFRVDYLLAITPALLLPLAYGLHTVHRKVAYQAPIFAWLGSAALVGIFVVLPLLLFSQFQKAPDWFGVRDYLATHVQPTDVVILSSADQKGTTDPAFAYYYQDRTPVLSLPRPDLNLTDAIDHAADQYRAIWFMPSGPNGGTVDLALRDKLQLISDEAAGRGLIMREYRSPTVKPSEIEQPLIVQSGSVALQGYSLERSRYALTVILYWQPGGSTTDTAYLHLIGPTNPATGTPLWTQDDHPPRLPDTAPRDVYHLSLANVQPGSYQLRFGLYDPTTGQRQPLTDANRNPLGDDLLLLSVTIPNYRQ